MSVAPETGRNRIMMALTSWSSRQPMARHWRSAFGAQLALAGPRCHAGGRRPSNEATGLLPRARVVLHNRVRGSRQLIVAQSADDVLDWVVDPGVRDVIAMRHVG